MVHVFNNAKTKGVYEFFIPQTEHQCTYWR